jgi:hypothetical protein
MMYSVSSALASILDTLSVFAHVACVAICNPELQAAQNAPKLRKGAKMLQKYRLTETRSVNIQPLSDFAHQY